MRVVYIKGTIALTDGSTSEFLITAEGTQQWGADTPRLGESVEVVEALTEALIERDLLGADKCAQCNADISDYAPGERLCAVCAGDD